MTVSMVTYMQSLLKVSHVAARTKYRMNIKKHQIKTKILSKTTQSTSSSRKKLDDWFEFDSN